MMADKRVAMDKHTEHFNRVHTQTQHGKDAKTIPKAHFDINNIYVFQMLLMLMLMMMMMMMMMISIRIIFLQLYFL